MENLTSHRLYRDHDFDTAFSELYGIYKRNFWSLFLLSLAGILILHLLFYYVGIQHMDFSGMAAEEFEPPRGFVSNILLVMLAGLLIYTFLNLAITWFVFRRQEDRDEPALNIFGQAAGKYYFRFLLLLILVSLILIAGIMLGVFALIIGSLLAAIYLGTSLFVSAPALVIERIGPGDAVARSFVLTHRDFWMTLGLVVVLYLIIMLIQFILTAIVSLPGAVAFISKLVSTGDGSELIASGQLSGLFGWGLAGVILIGIVRALALPLAPIFAVILYYKLKHQEDALPGKR